MNIKHFWAELLWSAADTRKVPREGVREVLPSAPADTN